MCLHLNEETEKQIAIEDIVCYKRVLINYIPYKNKSFTGIIDDIECEGKIQVEKNEVYFCTNEPKLNGISCDDKLGYLYSWKFDNYICSIIIDAVNIIIPTENSIFITPYQDAIVRIGKTYTSELKRFCNSINIGLHSFTTYKDARYDDGGVIVKCIIPKGAEYYLGNFGNKPSYASNEIKYIEIVTE